MNAEKQFTIHDAPAVLTIHLKRFTPLGRKLQHPVRYDDRLNLQSFMSEGQHGPTYSLYGVISHVGGGPNSGHYFAHVRGSDGHWYEMNDDSVERARRPDPLNMKSAYILFYIRDKGAALEAALMNSGLLGGTPTPKKRKDISDDERSDVRKDAQKESGRPFIGPVIPAQLRRSPVDPQAEKLKQKIEAAERDKRVKDTKTQNGVHRADSRSLKPLVDYEDNEDEETGERVDRLEVDMNGSRKGDSRGNAAPSLLPPTSSPTPASASSLKKTLNGDSSSPARPPPTTPLVVTSPAEEVIPPSTFYGSSSKRKSPDGGDVEMEVLRPKKERSMPLASASRSSTISDSRRPFGRMSMGTPFGKSRIGDNLHAERDRDRDNYREKEKEREQDEHRELFRPRKMHKKHFGSRPKFSI